MSEQNLPSVTNTGIASYDQIWQNMTTKYVEEQSLIRSGEAYCYDCTHYQFQENSAGEVAGDTGWCKRHAPTPARYPVGVEIEEVHVVWPTVLSTDSCGEFKLR